MRRVLIGVIVVIVLLLAVGYAVGGAVVYGQLSSLQAGCTIGNKAAWAQNTPGDFGTRDVYDLGNQDFSAYQMGPYETVSFPSRGEDVTLSGWYVPAAVADPTLAPAVILVHGLNDCKQSPYILLPAGMLHRAGFNVLMIDLRNHGESQRTDGRYAAGNIEYRDVLGAWDWLVNVRSFAPERIGLFGTSLGAATVMIAMGEEPRVAAAWEDSGFADIQVAIQAELERNKYPTLLAPAGILMGRLISGQDLTAYSPLKAAGKLNGRPVYITHGTADTRLSVQYAYDLADAIRASGGQVDPWIVEGSEHIMAMMDQTAEYEKRLVAFFQTSLGG